MIRLTLSEDQLDVMVDGLIYGLHSLRRSLKRDVAAVILDVTREAKHQGVAYQLPSEVTKYLPVCQVPDCGCTGEAHP